uniref:Methane monooxygenase subunit beta n=1 Tax=Candidatus Methylacidiphilum fumarolicum TaxID=591154 RepID=A9Q6C6_9BACT|nr:methane monooxygenase subunit beta [Methylacidiphilum fumariolicum SolV]
MEDTCNLHKRMQKQEFLKENLILLLLFPCFLSFVGGYHIHQMLLAGDWSFWTDWKDRMWWPVVAPIADIAFPAAVQSILWTKFKMPIGATFCTVGLFFGQWMNRYWNFWGWGTYPLNFVFPETLIPQAVVLDGVLMISNNFVVTALVGGELWGWLFYPTNWPMIAPYHVPVEYYGQLMSMADLIQYEYIRTSTPEYIRMVETGTMRSFAGGVLGVSAFFSGFVSACMYFLWWFFGKFFGSTKFVRHSTV